VLAMGWMRRLLHLLVDVTTRGLLALAIAMANWIVLVARAIVVPPIFETSSRGASHHGAQISRAHSELRTLGVAHRDARVHAGLGIAASVSRGSMIVVELGALLLQWHRSGCDTPDL
jgi:hypothetical protein